MKVTPRRKALKTKDVKPSVFPCPECNKSFMDKSSLYVHKRLHSTEVPYKCDICPYRCKIRKYLTRHVKKAHTKPTGNKCPVCGKCFHFDCKLRAHMRVHTGEKPYKCDVCDKAFSSSYSLSGHKLIHTGEKPFQCSFCDYACRDNSTIRRHMERHMGISKDFPCSICNKNFKKKETLQIHVDEVHFELDTRKIPCQHCDKVFKTKGTLTMHINTIHKKTNRVSCEICGCVVARNNILAHMRRHVDVRPYKCSYKPCGRRFKDKGDLKKHSLIHYPDRQYQCEICNRRFPRKSRLNAHLRLHMKNRNVQCDYCMEMFFTKVYLSKHIKRAHGPDSKKYICDICGTVTYKRLNTIRHLKYGHGNENDNKCQLCKKFLKNSLSLKEHYLKHHNLKYVVLPEKNEEELAIKEEPVEELVATVPEFLFEVQVEKHEIEDTTLEVSLQPPSPRDFDIDVDTITYSKKVLSEDVSRSLIERDGHTEDAFDDFFIGHVMKKPEDIIDMPKQIVDEKKKVRVQKCLEQLLAEVRLRKDRKSLETLRRQYNKRIKMATNSCNKKEQKSIRYFKKSESSKESSDSQNNDKESHIDSDNQDIDITNKINNQKDETINHGNLVDNNVNNDDEKHDKVDKHNKVDENDEVDKHDNIDKHDKIDENEKVNDNDDDLANDDDDKDSDYKDSDLDSDEDTNTNGKLKFNTHQCYICFKLFKTKLDLKRHCRNHFDICNDKMLKKCPFCGYVTNLQITKHIKAVHKITLDIPYSRITERETQNGSKYVFEIDENCDLEIIPSISNLNKIASMKIDEQNRASKNVFMGTTKLVRKGNDWVVEKQAVAISNDCLLPEFTDEEYQSLKFVGSTYLERIKSLSVLGKKKGVKMMYPCEGCDKICLTLSALKLHNRRHEANPKIFKPKVWKNKILNGKGGKNGKSNGKKRKRVSKSKNCTESSSSKNWKYVGNSKNKINNGQCNKEPGKLEVAGKNGESKIANRFADPNPVKNKHKCDKALIDFYKNNIKGGDIEFWQFLKIFNKMSRENVNDFKDLENRFDFGVHKIIIDQSNDTETNIDEPQKTERHKNKSTKEPIIEKSRVIRKKTGKCKKQAFTRAILISKKEHLKRIEIKNQMRKRLEGSQ